MGGPVSILPLATSVTAIESIFTEKLVDWKPFEQNEENSLVERIEDAELAMVSLTMKIKNLSLLDRFNKLKDKLEMKY